VKQVSQRDIARRVGCSVMAVSKALRDAPDIGSGLKQRVRSAADELGYLPNANARTLRSARTGLIGVILPRVELGFFANILSGVLRSAGAQGLEVMVAQTDENPQRELAEVRSLLSRLADGIIIAPCTRVERRHELLELTHRRGTPMVFVDRYPAGVEQFPHASCVVAQDRLGGELATRHLIEQGHTRILHLAGPMGASSTEERLAGYRRALVNAGLKCDDDLVYRAGSMVEDGRRAMSQAASEGREFTAVFAANDYVAVGACDVLFSQHVRVPEDVSVIGFGNVRLARYHRVPLTTIDQPQEALGEMAHVMLEEFVAGRRPEARAVPVQLLVRDSVGPAPRG
jgi:LacI family transcriptional regulator